MVLDTIFSIEFIVNMYISAHDAYMCVCVRACVNISSL